MSECEFGKCECCGKEGQLGRKYFNYNIKCECHSPSHFEMRRHCANCEPITPERTKIEFTIKRLNEIIALEQENADLRAKLKESEERNNVILLEWDKVNKLVKTLEYCYETTVSDRCLTMRETTKIYSIIRDALENWRGGRCE